MKSLTLHHFLMKASLLTISQRTSVCHRGAFSTNATNSPPTASPTSRSARPPITAGRRPFWYTGHESQGGRLDLRDGQIRGGGGGLKHEYCGSDRADRHTYAGYDLADDLADHPGSKILESVDQAAVQAKLSPKTSGGSVHDDEPPPRATRGFSADQVIQLLQSDQPAPTDEECDRILEEELMKKYSP